MSNSGADPKGLGSLKRLQAAIESVANGGDVPNLLSPFFVLYDLRGAYSHLTSAEKATVILRTGTVRLGIIETSGLIDVYGKLMEKLTDLLEQLIKLIKA